MKDLLLPLGYAYGVALDLRNQLFDWKILRSEKINAPVISVGNLTTGGTGKTPLIEALLRQASRHHLKAGVISRGYGGKFRNVWRVTPDSKVYFGDEPTLLAKKNPEVPVYVGKDRVAAGRKLLAEQPVNLLLADDAFQHRRLHRDLDILVVDATQPMSVYRPLPWGWAREWAEPALWRADVVIITKGRWERPENLAKLERWIRSHVRPDVVVTRADWQFDGSRCLNGSGVLPTGAKVRLVCAIGRPENFSQLIANQVDRFRIVNLHSFRDHYKFKQSDVDRLEAFGDECLLVTEKDAVKLSGLRLADSRWFVAMVKMVIEPEGEALIDEILVRLAR